MVINSSLRLVRRKRLRARRRSGGKKKRIKKNAAFCLMKWPSSSRPRRGPYLVPGSIPNAFWIATAMAGIVVFCELWALAGSPVIGAGIGGVNIGATLGKGAPPRQRAEFSRDIWKVRGWGTWIRTRINGVRVPIPGCHGSHPSLKRAGKMLCRHG
jgi:hypothetical protein